MSNFNIHSTFVTNDAHRHLFRDGHLVEEWSCMYPMLFDAKDIETALNQKSFGYHYYEWFAAILIYHTTGLLSLIETYAYKSDERKRQILETLVTGQVLEYIASKGKQSLTQCPDLLVYSSNRDQWFFCEVKGPRDKLREKQAHFFEELSQISGKEIQIVHFRIEKIPHG